MSYLTVDACSEGYYEEKKSRFLSFLIPVKTEEEAKDALAAIRKKYWDARHHVYAYRIGNELSPFPVKEKFYDDSEPAQTAGLPTMTVLKGAGLFDAMIITVRYFGGTLLGTGGLVKAYTAGAKDAIAHAHIIEVKEMVTRRLVCPYPLWDSFKYRLDQSGLSASDIVYADAVSAEVTLEKERESELDGLLVLFGLA